VLLYSALGIEPPVFAHLPMIIGPDRAKLSKRHGAVSIGEYSRQGFLHEAMFNFLGLLGWSLDDHTEIISKQQFVDNFNLGRIGVTAAIFDMEKLTWMNGVYIRQLTVEDLTERMLPFLDRDLPPSIPRPLGKSYVMQITPLIQERLKRLDEAAELTGFFFLDDGLPYDLSLLLGKRFVENSAGALAAIRSAYERLTKASAWESEALENLLRPLAEELGLKTGDFFGLLRVAVTGRTAAPPLFQTMEALGRDKTLARLNIADRRLDDSVAATR
jgi:glutamyl-tRNA synthetase